MFAIEVEYLSRVVATQFNDRSQAEWPPHFARLYSALVATFKAGEQTAGERESLTWLAALPPPEIYATAASRRAVHTHYVPVNDPTVINQTPIHNALRKVREIEAALADATDDRQRRKLARRRDTARKKLDDTARRMAEAMDKAKKPSLEILPGHRKKQARTFPSVTPEDPRVYWVWPESSPPPALRPHLDGLVRAVVRVGHSSTLVRARLVDRLPQDLTPNWHPDPQGQHFMRVPLSDQLERLEQLHEQHHGIEPRVLPFRWQTYTEDADEQHHASTVHAQRVWSPDDWIIFQRADGPTSRPDNVRYLPLTRGADLARRVRDALLNFADQARLHLPEAVTGHRPDGRPSDRPHMAVIPLAYVGSHHADGKLRGVALVMPAGSSTQERRVLLQAIGAWEESARHDKSLTAINEDLDIPIVPIWMGRAGVFHMTRLLERANIRSLRPARWTRPSQEWRSVTPVALDRNPGDLHSQRADAVRKAAAHAEQTIRRACRRQQLPDPVAVDVSFSPGVTGSLPATEFPSFPTNQRAGKPRRVLVHLTLRFDAEVEGPVILGAGRYYGLGLCLPTGAPRRPLQEATRDA